VKTIIYINGVGRSEKSKNFSKKFQKELGPEYKHIEFSWQANIEGLADDYLKRTFKKPKGIHWKKKITYKLRSLLFDYAVDATAYPNFKDRILEDLDKIVEDQEEVIFICHSLGGLIAYDYLDTYRFGVVSKLITMGCSIPFFKLGKTFWVPSCCLWYNFYEPNDVLSMPIKPMARNVLGSTLIHDHKFNSKNWFKSWNVASHNSYWKSDELIEDIKEVL